VFKLPQLQILDAAVVDEETRQNAAKVYTGRLTEDMLLREEPNRREQVNLSSLELTLLDHQIVSSRFQSVKHLNLEKNNLNDVSALRALPHLEKLHLRHNRINVAFGQPGAFGNLKFLDLSSNNISSLGTLRISSCRNLRTLFLCNNFLTRLDGINQLKSLKTLKADRNKLCRMDAQTFEGCERLKFVSLRRNALRTLGHLSKLFSVRELHLQDNHIDNEDELRWLTSLTKLKSLSLSGNNLSSSSDIYRELSDKCSMNLARSGCILHINKNTTVTPHCDVGSSQ
jgi:Leucine-rich repeat (LRR) protein